MRRHQQKKVKYGVSSAFLAFLGGWAVTMLVTPDTGLSAPRWQATLWIYLGAHYVDLARQNLVMYSYVNPLAASYAPTTVRVVPIAAVAAASAYTTSQIRTRRVGRAISNALGAGMGYFLVGIGAVLVSEMRPGVSGLLMLALLVGGSVWVGSAFIRKATGGLPFIGFTSLGTIAAIGLLLILGGMAVVSALWGLIAISFGTSAAVGALVGVSRQLESRGDSHRRFARTRGFSLWLRNNWLEALIFVVILGALAVGLSGGAVLGP